MDVCVLSFAVTSLLAVAVLVLAPVAAWAGAVDDGLACCVAIRDPEGPMIAVRWSAPQVRCCLCQPGPDRLNMEG
jgi:hypothetical protein